MKKKNFIQRFLENWHAKTPKFWKAIIGISAFVGTTVPTLAVLNLPNIPVPALFTDNAWTVMAVSLSVGAFAKTRVKLPKKGKK